VAESADTAPTALCEECHADLPATALFCPNCGTATASGRALGPVLAGYTILRSLGEGGAAVVYLARQEALDRLVAVKVLRRGVEDERAWRQFRREATTIARLSAHPNVVTVYTAGRSQSGQPYLVTEFLDRGSLSDVIAAEGPLPPSTVARVGVAVADALVAAHALGILHRDVKPGNVLLDRHGRIKLADFGIARLLSGQSTTTDVIAFTPEHVAPETLRGEPDGPWSDVYGLASALATALIGTSPFARRPDERVDALISRKLMSPAPSLPVSVPPALSRTIRRALDPEPSGRPSLIEFRQQLAAAADELDTRMPSPPPGLAAMPPPALPDVVPAASGETLSAQLRRGRRRRLAIAAGTAVLIAAAVVVAAVFVAARRDGGTAISPTTRVVVAPATASAATSTTPPSTAPPTPPATSDRAEVGPVATVAPPSSVPDTPPPVVTAAPTAVTALPTAPPTVETAGAAVPPTTVTAATTTPAASADTSPSAGDQALVTESQAETFIRSYYDAVTDGDYDTSWSQLAPEFQQGKARSFDYYVDFWNDNDIDVGTVHLIDADPEHAIVNVELRWNGSSTSVIDQFTLHPDEDGRPLIAGQITLDGG
jgi:serine/threonine-protein kinase PknK